MTRPGHPTDRKAAADFMRRARIRHARSVFSRKEWNKLVRLAAYDNLAQMTGVRKSIGQVTETA